MSNAAMDTRSTTFVIIDKLVSPSSSVNGNPLFHFDHWQPRSPPSFPFAGQVKGRTGPPLRTKDLPALGCSSRAVKPWDLLPRSWHSQDKLLLMADRSIRRVTNGLGDPRFRWSRDWFVAELFFGSNPVLDIFSVFAPALKIQLMSPASDLFSRWFSESNNCTLLGCQDGAGAPTGLRMRDVDYLPFAET